MSYLQRIQTQIIVLVAVAIVALTALVTLVQLDRQRDALVESTYQQGQIAGGALRESIASLQSAMLTFNQFPGVQDNMSQSEMTWLMLQLAQNNLNRYVSDNPGISFAALLSSEGMVFMHTNSIVQGQPASNVNLENIPIDDTVRRSVPGYDEVYLVRTRISFAEPLEPAAYDLVIGMTTQTVDNALQDNLSTAVQVMLVVLLIIVLIAFLLIREGITQPLQTIQASVRAFGEGDLTVRLHPTGSTETRALAGTFNQMGERLLAARAQLESLYQQAEADLREHARDLEIAAQIGRSATSFRDVETLLYETVQQIRGRFEAIYHAQIFLLDDLNQYAVLVESTGDAGQQLLDLQHKIEIGSNSVIGRVTSSGETVIASDTHSGTVPWRPNPLLPDTHAEMALPLKIEDRVIGALDVQSMESDVFTEDMVETFEILADQLAVAIENARLLAESDLRIEQIDLLNQQLAEMSWRQFLAEQRDDRPEGYSYDQMRVAPLKADGDSPAEGDQVEVPIQVHNKAIGALITELPGNRQLSHNEQLLVEAVADRVALAVENARLFERTQRALAETERLYETARTVSSATELESIFQLVTEQLSTGARIDLIAIMLSGPDPMLVQYLEHAYAWDQAARGHIPETRERLAVPPLTFSEDDVLPVTAPAAYNNLTAELPPDHPLYGWLINRQQHSAVMAPITASGRWFGLLLCSSASETAINTAYISFVGALADQLALAIENRRLFEEAQTEARRARALAEAGQIASQIAGDYTLGLTNLFEAVSGPGNYDRWWFGLMNENFTHLQPVITRGIETPETVDVLKDENTLAEAARIGEIVLINAPDEYPFVDEASADVVAGWGKHIAMPVRIQDEVIGVLLIGRSLDDQNLDERDIQLAATLASQIAVATQNQTLFTEAESQRQRLQIIVDTMPTGILVMDKAGRVILSNQNLLDLLGPEMHPNNPERPQPYPMVNAVTDQPYKREEWPLSRVFRTSHAASVDDMVIIHPDGTRISVLAQAAPIYDQQGQISAVVGAFQDITHLQELERALQDSLRETTMLYEASRSISRATGMDELLQATLGYMNTLQPDQAYIFLSSRAAGPSSEPVTLVAQHPDDIDHALDACTLSPLFADTTILMHRESANGPVVQCMDQLGIATIGSFPLSVRGEINGWLLIAFEETQNITREQRRFLTTLADQAAVTIENQRLLEQTARALEETAVLYHASRTLSEAQTAEDILQAFVENAAAHELTYAGLYILLGESASVSYAAIELIAQHGAHPSADPIGTRYRIDQFPFWGEIHQEQITHIHALDRATNLLENTEEALRVLALQGVMIIPLQAGDRPLGGIVLGMSRVWPYAEDEIRVYEALADQAGVALENIRLYEQTQQRARQLATSAEISRAVTSILHLNELLPQVVNQIRDGFGYDHVQVFLVSADGRRANLVASTGEAGRQLLEYKHYLEVGSHSVIGQVTALGTPQIALDTADARVVHRPNPILPDTRSEMALPLIARGQILGALDVQSNQSGAFTEEDTRVLAALADMVATAIDNAQLFELAESRAEEMSFLFNITTAAATSTDLDESLAQVAQRIQETMEAMNVSIYLPSTIGDELVRGANAGDQGTETQRTRVSIDRGLVGWIARKREAIVIDDISQDPRRLDENSNARAVMGIPLLSGGELVGVLTVESDQVATFTNSDLQLLQTLSGSLSGIIQSSRLLVEMQVVNEQLMEVDRLKTNFLAAMSHELRTPLNSIIGFSRVILKGIDGPLTETQEQDLGTIYESGKHLLGLVNDILDQAKIEAGKMELEYKYFKLDDVIKGVMSSAVGLTREKSIQLHTNIEGPLPDAYGDEFRTRQVLLNLVSNAAKFTEEGSITVLAYPVEYRGHRYIQVSVIDTGIGIAPEDMHKLFEAFQQVDNSLTRKVGGTGMGLPLAKSFTELQHGRLWVESEVGVGSTFSFIVPVEPMPDDQVIDDSDGATAGMPPTPAPVPLQSAVVTETAPETHPRAGASAASDDLPASAPPRPTKTALVIEDNEGVVGFYKRYLEPEGYEVIGVTDPTSVRFTLAVRPHVILLDVNMRDGTGWKVLEEIKSLTNAPIIVCSMNADRERGLALGAAEYLFKPFSQDQLVEAVRRTEAQSRQQRILLVDDQPESIRAFREALSASSRYTVLEATSGEQALALMQAETIDLVILDLRMPGIDGFQVLQSIRTNPDTAHIPVLVLTAEDISANEREALASIDIMRKDDVDETFLLDRVEARLIHNGENT